MFFCKRIAVLAVLIALGQNAIADDRYTSEKVSFYKKGVKINLISKNSLLFKYEKTPERYSIRNLVDRDKKTAWATKVVKAIEYSDGTDGDLIIEFEKPVFLKNIMIRNGYQKSRNIYQTNRRVKLLLLSPNFFGVRFGFPSTETIHIPDQSEPFQINFIKTFGTIYQVVPIGSLVIAIDAFYNGSKYNDICISEIDIDFAFKPTYVPKISMKKLLDEISSSIIYKDEENWDAKVISRIDNSYFIDLLFYAMNRNKEAQKFFLNYKPLSTHMSEVMTSEYLPAYKAYLNSNP